MAVEWGQGEVAEPAAECQLVVRATQSRTSVGVGAVGDGGSEVAERIKQQVA